MGRYRPVLHPHPPKGIDPRVRTRYATPEEKGLARHALKTLERERLVVSLAPAPDPHFEGHKIRVVDCRNPSWYRGFAEKHQLRIKRIRVIRALRRVVDQGRVRGNGYERELLEIFKELRNEYARRKPQAFG